MKIYTWEDISDWDPCEDWTFGRYAAIFPNGATALEILRCESIPAADRIWAFAYGDFVGNREKRLFAVKCARTVEHLMADDRSLRALEVAEDYANGNATTEQLKEAWEHAQYAWEHAQYACWDDMSSGARAVAWGATWAYAPLAAYGVAEEFKDLSQKIQYAIEYVEQYNNKSTND